MPVTTRSYKYILKEIFYLKIGGVFTIKEGKNIGENDKNLNYCS